MTDQTDGDQTDIMPLAKGLDELWHANTITADAAERGKQKVLAADFQQDRALRYVLSEGREDIGGWLQSASCNGREIYRQRGCGIDWR
jgi:hypothetical protein